MKEFIRKIVLLTVTLVLVGIGISCQNSFSGDDGGEESSPSLQAPVFTPASGQFSEGFKIIEIENKNNMGDIFYTVDGSNPSAESFRYTGPFKIYNSSVVKAVVIYNKSASLVVSSKYELNVGKTQTQLGIISGKIGLSNNLPEDVKEQLKNTDVYIFSDDLPGKVITCKMGGSYYIDGLDTSRTYDFYFTNTEPGVVQGAKTSRAATAEDENGRPLVANKNSIKPESGAGIEVDVNLSATGTIKGTAKRFDVTGAEEADQGGISVYIPGTSYSALTDKNGNFAMSGIPQGLHTIRAQYAGYTFVEKENVLLQTKDENAPETIIPETFNLSFGRGIVKGSVVLSDATEAGENAGILVNLSESTNTYSYSAVTNLNGNFSIVDIYPGTYTVEISKEGYDSAIISEIKVNGASCTSIPTTTLQVIGGKLSGKVSVDGLTVFDGITVLAENENGKKYFGIVNSAGEFSWESVSPGTYKITANYAGYKSISVSGIVVSMGNDVSDIRLSIKEKAIYTITGKVLREGMDSGFEGTSVVANNSTDKSFSKTAVTGTDGTFILSEVEPGDYMITISREGYITDNSIYVSVGTQAIEVIPDVILKNLLGSVKGTVTLESALDNAGIEILLKSEKNEKTFSIVTDTLGRYSISGIEPGTWRVQATKGGYNTGLSDAFSVNAGNTTEVSAMELKISHRSIYGTVVLEGRTDATGVRITATNVTKTNEIYSALSNKDGVYALSGMIPGEYILSYSYEGYRSYTGSSVNLKEDSSLNLEAITLGKATGKISGIVNLEGCSDHSGITVSINGTDYTYVTEADGSYEFTVPSGNYPGGVRFKRDDFQLTAKADTIPVLTDSTYGVLTVEMKCISVPVKGVIDLAGTDDNSGIKVTVDGLDDVETLTDTEGNWKLEHIPLGYRTFRFSKVNVPDVTSEKLLEPSIGLDIGKIGMIPDSATLKGHVYLTDMTDHQGILITVKTVGQEDMVFKTSSDGSFEATNILASGSHDIIFSKNGWVSQTITISDLVPLEEREIGANKEFILKDTEKPVVSSVVINSGANSSSSTKLNVDIIASDAGSGLYKMGVQVIPTIGGVDKQIYPSTPAWTDYKTGFEYNLEDLPAVVYSGNGTYTLVVSVKDKAGNISEVCKKAIRITDIVTTISGVLKGDNLHLTKDRSPYLVVADCNVTETDTLVIEPGVEVRFDGEFCISVSGEINARGTKDEKILFTSNSVDKETIWTEEEYGEYIDENGNYQWGPHEVTKTGIKTTYWTGIAINGSSVTVNNSNEYVSGNIMEYCEIEYTDSPLTVKAGAYINHCKFSKAKIRDWDADNYGHVYIKSTNIYSFNSTFETGVRLYDASGIFANNKVLKTLGMDWSCGSLFRQNHISNASVSFNYFQGYCSDNIFESVSFNISGNNNSGVISNNNFVDCASPIVTTTESYQIGRNYNFTNNYWGEGNTEELEYKGSDANISFISDNYDNFRYMKVDYSGWLTSANSNAGTKGEAFIPVGNAIVNCTSMENQEFTDPEITKEISYGGGSYTPLDKITLYVDGVPVRTDSEFKNYNAFTYSSSYSLGLPYMNAGKHTLKVVLVDKDGNTSEKSSYFTIIHSDTSSAELAGVSWNKTTGQPLKDSRTAYLWHLDASENEASDTNANIGNYTNSLGGLGGCSSNIYTSDNISLDLPNNAFTVEYWIKGSNRTRSPYLNIGKEDCFYIDSGICIYYETSNSSIDSHWSNISGPSGDGKWHHVAYVYGSNYVASYVDGILTNYSNNMNIEMYNSTKKLYISSDSNRFDAVDELRISNEARSADEIAAYYKDASEAMKRTTGSLDAIVY
ncbi:MAG: carboxypeptidase regulatory-like domain-containing protein [Treponema sp.]